MQIRSNAENNNDREPFDESVLIVKAIGVPYLVRKADIQLVHGQKNELPVFIPASFDHLETFQRIIYSLSRSPLRNVLSE